MPQINTLTEKWEGEGTSKIALIVSVSLLLLPVTVPNIAYCQPPPPQNGPYVYVLVNSTLYVSLSSALSTYKQDLENDGFSVKISQDFGNSAEAVREFLQTEAETHEMAGVLLVGKVPYATYITKIDDYNYTYPWDLYYMDLDGNWIDSDGDGIYDGHSSGDGDLGPEIWTGRLYASTMTGNETELLINYFDKNHHFRTCELTLPRRALAYLDDGYPYFLYDIDSVNNSLRMIYGSETTLVTDPETTSAAHYKNTLNDTLGYEWLHLEAHGHFQKHCFNTSKGWTEIFSSEIRSIDPHAFFYSVMACDSADFTLRNLPGRTDYIGGSYIFADTYGLLVVSSTKPGAMGNYPDFYKPISEGKCIGEAFQEWFEKTGELDRISYYGLTILGDPTLRAPRICDVAITDVTASKSVVVQNLTLSINVTVENIGKGNFTESFNVTLYANTTIIGNMSVTNLQPLTTRTLALSWNTTGVAKGNYCVSATAVLPIDNNPDDNTYTDGWIAVILRDDLAVVYVTPSNSRVVQNSTLIITVTVENKGNFTETFNVTVYANTSLVGTQTGITLTSRNSTTLAFTWNTTGFARGDYLISAVAVLPVDNDPSDNVFTDGWVAVTFKDDIAVTTVAAGDSLNGEIEVHSGWNVNINVTVGNEGVSVETFNLTVYADVNTTVIGDEIIIGTQTNITLAAGNSKTLNFTWITTGFPTCRNYTISGYAHPVSNETDTLDNLRVGGKIYVRLMGDADGDGDVDVVDQRLVQLAMFTMPGYPSWNAYADIDGDGDVDVVDQRIQQLHMFQSCS